MTHWSGSDRGKAQKPKGQGPAWLGTGAPGAGQASSAQWKASAGRKKDPEATSRAVRTFFVVTALVLLAGFIYLVITRPEPTPLISLRAGTYPLQMPPLAFADEDDELLSRASPSNVRVMPIKLDSVAALDDFRKSLQAAGRGFNYFRRGNDVLLLHIAAHGVANDAGKPCLVPSAADPFDSDTWLPLTKVFDAIRSEPMLKGKNKLVMLDCQRVLSCWRCGWLENRFDDAISAAVKEANDPELIVLSAADAGQINWPAPELRSSVFTHFVARGLRGEGANSSSVSLFELCRFVVGGVDAYTSQRRNIRQQPVLFHGEAIYRLDDSGKFVDAAGKPAKIENFTLAYIDRWRSKKNFDEIRSAFDPLADAKRLLGPSRTGEGTASEGKQSLNQLWSRYRERRSPPSSEIGSLPAYSVDPVAWSSIEQRLAAIGERLFAGREYQGATLQTEIERLAKDLNNDDAWRPRGALPKLSYLQAARQDLSATDTVQSVGENTYSLYLKTEAAKRDEVLPKRVISTRLIKDIYTVLCDGSVSGDARANLHTAVELFDRYRQPSDAYLLEEHFLKLFDRGAVPGEPLSSGQLALALKARQLAELAASPRDLRVHYAFESMVNAADDKRREAEDLVLLGSESRRSENLWKESAADSPGHGYAATIAHEDRLADCLQLRDEIWADLPILAEWKARQVNNPQTSTVQELVSVLQGAIDLDDAIERALRSRDEADTFAARIDRCQRAFQTVGRAWDAVRMDLEKVYDLPTNVEQAYRRGENIRAAESALHIPPLAGSSSQFIERYLQTLEQWASEGPGQTGSAAKDASQSAAKSADSSSSQITGNNEIYPLFRELHRAIAYEFIDPYDQHRHAKEWDENRNPDSVFRAAGQNATWPKLRKLLDTYNEAIASESPAWGQSQRAVAAAAKLRQWDRRIRVAGPWLSSFHADLKRPTQPTPARWLQEFDAAHWIAWQAYRAKCDFWGNGQRPGSAHSRPYFADAIDQCESVLPESLRPIRYDIPGGGIADFSERSGAALAALDRWEPIATPRSPRGAAGNAGEVKIDLAIQPLSNETTALRLPSGIATLSVQSSSPADGNTASGSFDSTGNDHTRPIPLPLFGKEPTPVTAYVHISADHQPPASELDARLWYRGHVRTKPCPLPRPAGSQFVEYEFAHMNYAAPTVEVRGNDAARGAVLFIFDCSASMTTESRFSTAKQSLERVLDRLGRNAGPGLRVGLMAYGTRTKAFGREDQPDLFYQFKSHPDKAPLLTSAGQQMQQRMGGPFVQSYPHPDRDLLELVPVATGTPAQAKAKLNELREAQCVGCTPLYYSIASAMQNGFRGLNDAASGAHQIVVVSDGVNMPYNCAYDERTRNYSLGQTGQLVNEEDYGALSRVLESTPGIHVTVQLFGVLASDFDRNQYSALKRLETRHSNLKAVNLPDANQLEQSIVDSFPRVGIEMRSAQPGGESQPLLFNQPRSVRDWPSDGLLRRDSVRQIVRLKSPGEAKSIEKDLDLLGGERVVLQYEPRDGQLSFIDDGLTRRASATVQPPRASDSRRLLFDALDPERVGLTVSKLHFRLRDDDDARRFTPRPKYVWVEVRPLLAGGALSERAFPCMDVSWKENINLPRLQMPVEHWPECSTARAKVWLRYTDPLALAQASISRDRSSQLITAGADKWQIEQVGGDGGAPRKITAIWEPGDSASDLQNLIDCAIWLSPPPDVTRRQYALDGSAAIHEFTYNREGVGNVEIRIVSRSQFEQGAYSAELEFDVAN